MSIGYAGDVLDGTAQLPRDRGARSQAAGFLLAVLGVAVALVGAGRRAARANVWPSFNDLVWAGLAVAGSVSVWGHGVALLVAAGCWAVISGNWSPRGPGAR